MRVAKSQLAEAEGKIGQARGALQQALDEFDTRSELRRRNPNAIPQREVTARGWQSIQSRALWIAPSPTRNR